MTKKIHGVQSDADVTSQTRIPGTVGRPVIGGCSVRMGSRKKHCSFHIRLNFVE